MASQDSSDEVKRELAELERRAAFERQMELEWLATMLRAVNTARLFEVFQKHSGTDVRD
jgi:predicted nucleic acid-binding protein